MSGFLIFGTVMVPLLLIIFRLLYSYSLYCKTDHLSRADPMLLVNTLPVLATVTEYD